MRKYKYSSLLIVSVILLGRMTALPNEKNRMEKNKALARRVFEEIYGQGKIDLVDRLYADDFVDDSPGGGRGRDLIKKAVAGFHRGRPGPAH
jgi:hypothetical protein